MPRGAEADLFSLQQVRHRHFFWPLLCVLILLMAGFTADAKAHPFVPVEGKSDARWKALEKRLQNALAGNPGEGINILQLGDSHTAGYAFPDSMRQHFQSLFGVGSVGLLPPGNIRRHPVSVANISSSTQWLTDRPRYDGGALPLGLGGYLGAGRTSYQSVEYEIAGLTRPSRVYVYSRGQGRPENQFSLYANRSRMEPVRQKVIRKGRTVFEVPSGVNHLTLLSKPARSAFELLGLTVMGNGGATYSSVGVIGATIDVLRGWDSDITRNQIRDFDPDLLIIAFGTNDVVNSSFSRDAFFQSLTYTAAWIRRNAPDAAVLLVMPPNAPGFKPYSVRNLETARMTMRIAARRFNWRVWDWASLTAQNCVSGCGTPDAVPFFGPDGIHMTKQGYETTADALYTSIISSYKHY